jgi:hypothetical protein
VREDRAVARASSLRASDGRGRVGDAPALEVAPRERVLREDVLSLGFGAFRQRHSLVQLPVVIGKEPGQLRGIWGVESPARLRQRVRL